VDPVPASSHGRHIQDFPGHVLPGDAAPLQHLVNGVEQLLAQSFVDLLDRDR